ncbi:DinB family protein [Paenibacillus sp. CGMCC 1.16610]|uniref:DinB family protein n=1 Tax=Paenibacillus anseongense TaxID=2682845 RepID=A0ABW9UDP0_9BACL|nr:MULTISPECIES: DinB family protein [Paenibacillus]MBA2938255.1 DinB family protein [Paenibacillus sp. CGMCC 1.16610]MVQ37313.1 DinB family protein [Paenibacillus anseongense]
MEHFLFRQLAFVRNQVLQAVEGISEETADQIPNGFRNSIRWQLGHIYVVMERYAFQYMDLPVQLPQGFKEQFEYKTSPLTTPADIVVPTLSELKFLLKNQIERISSELGDRLQDNVTPYTTSAGMKLESLEQFLSFNLYHEGMHFSVIKIYKVLLSQ